MDSDKRNASRRPHPEFRSRNNHRYSDDDRECIRHVASSGFGKTGSNEDHQINAHNHARDTCNHHDFLTERTSRRGLQCNARSHRWNVTLHMVFDQRNPSIRFESECFERGYQWNADSDSDKRAAHVSGAGFGESCPSKICECHLVDCSTTAGNHHEFVTEWTSRRGLQCDARSHWRHASLQLVAFGRHLAGGYKPEHKNGDHFRKPNGSGYECPTDVQGDGQWEPGSEPNETAAADDRTSGDRNHNHFSSEWSGRHSL